MTHEIGKKPKGGIVEFFGSVFGSTKPEQGETLGSFSGQGQLDFREKNDSHNGLKIADKHTIQTRFQSGTQLVLYKATTIYVAAKDLDQAGNSLEASNSVGLETATVNGLTNHLGYGSENLEIVVPMKRREEKNEQGEHLVLNGVLRDPEKGMIMAFTDRFIDDPKLLESPVFTATEGMRTLFKNSSSVDEALPSVVNREVEMIIIKPSVEPKGDVESYQQIDRRDEDQKAISDTPFDVEIPGQEKQAA